jgi:hypothetical protein
MWDKGHCKKIDITKAIIVALQVKLEALHSKVVARDEVIQEESLDGPKYIARQTKKYKSNRSRTVGAWTDDIRPLIKENEKIRGAFDKLFSFFNNLVAKYNRGSSINGYYIIDVMLCSMEMVIADHSLMRLVGIGRSSFDTCNFIYKEKFLHALIDRIIRQSFILESIIRATDDVGILVVWDPQQKTVIYYSGKTKLEDIMKLHAY